MKKLLNRQHLQIPYRKPTKALPFTHRTPTAYLRNAYKMDYRMKYMELREMTLSWRTFTESKHGRA
ncbi:hypothetical protein ACTG1N_23450, partial [Aeromonas dhakensis]|uniref:hypothetical protein n=1 Tax=Aeromonas dhakensis TaxID=196024 RepID=UPI003F79FB74